MIHRDVLQKRMCCLTVSVPVDTYKTGGIEIWLGSQDFLPDRIQANEPGKMRIRNLAQRLERKKFESIVVEVKRGEALVFDSRLWHRSLVHRDFDKERHAYTFMLGINGGQANGTTLTRKAGGWIKREECHK